MTPDYDAEHRVDPDPNGRPTLDLDALDRGTDVVLPDGEVRASGRFASGLEGVMRFRAAEGADPTLVIPPGYNDFVVTFTGDHFVFDGIDVDVRADRTTAGIRAHADTVVIRDVEFVGRGTHPDDEVSNCLSVAVTDPGGTGIVRNVVAAEGSSWARFKDAGGRMWAWVGPDHVGHLRFQGCRAEEFGNNAIYASEAAGPVSVERCEFWNNNVASVRLGSDGSAVSGTTIGIDPDRYTGPREPAYEAESFFMRGVWAEMKRAALDSPGRIAIGHSRIVVRGGADGRLPAGAYGIAVRPNMGALDVHDTDVRVSAPDVRPILAKRPGDAGPHPPPDPPYDVTLERTRIVDTTPVGALVTVVGRDLSVGDGCCLEATADGTDGVVVRDGACSVGACTVAVPGRAVRADTNPDLAALATDGSCEGEWTGGEGPPAFDPIDLPGGLRRSSPE